MAIDWTRVYKKYKGLWVALKDDEVTVIASGSSVSEVAMEAKKRGHDNPIFFRVPQKMMPYIGSLVSDEI